MPLVGLTGGVATGKSTVARLFADCGAVIIDADLLARRVVEPNKPAWRELVRAFGPRILNPDRSLNRAAVATLAFGDRRKLQRLNAIVHPRVAREQAALTKQAFHADPRAVVVYDAPVLIEAGAHRRMDRLVVVVADQQTQIERLKRRNGLRRQAALRRIRSQMPLSAKVKLADYVLDGRQPIGQLRGQVKRIYQELRRLVPGRESTRATTASRPHEKK